MNDGLNRLFSSAGTDLLRAESDKHETVGQYVARLTKSTSTVVLEALSDVARTIEPIDPALSPDETYPIEAAFTDGAVLALHLVHVLAPSLYDVFLSQLHVDIEQRANRPDKVSTRFGIGQAAELVECCDRGFALAESLHGLLAQWEDELCPDVRHQIYLQRGFGFVFYVLDKISQPPNEAYMREIVEQLPDFNWDAEFKDWFGEAS